MKKHGQLDLFGGVTETQPRKKGRNETFNDYEAYVAKFEDRPRTTDDTFTPPDVFAAVLGWLKGKGKITGDTKIIRPFYPGGDFETADYPDGCAVVDNPPFSIFAMCCKWFTARGVPFFLFGPGLTIASISGFCTCIITYAAVRFENGAVIPVSFASNMFGGAAAIAAGDLTQMINGCESQREGQRKSVRKMAWPDGVVTVADLRKIAKAGGTFELQREFSEVVKQIGGEIFFGSAWLSGQYADVARSAAAAEAAAEAAAAKAAVKVEMKPSERQTLERLCALYRQKGGNAPETGGQTSRENRKNTPPL